MTKWAIAVEQENSEISGGILTVARRQPGGSRCESLESMVPPRRLSLRPSTRPQAATGTRALPAPRGRGSHRRRPISWLPVKQDSRRNWEAFASQNAASPKAASPITLYFATQ